MHLICLQCCGFFGFVGAHTGEHLGPVHLVGIEFRSVHADEFGFASHGDTARAAHSCSVHHNGVEGSFGRNIVLGGGEGDELHHDRRTDGDALVHFLPVDHFFHADGHDTLFAHGAVVGHNNQFVRPLCEFVLEDDEVFIPRGEHGDDAVSGFLERFGDRQHRCSTDASAGANDRSVVLNTCSASKGSYDVVNIFAGFQSQQFVGRNAHLLNDQCDGTFFGVGAGDGERNTFGECIHTNNDKMAGTAATGNERSLYNEFRYIG